MDQVLRGSATTAEAIHQSIQNSQERRGALAKRQAKQCQGSRAPSTIFSAKDEAVIFASRKHTLLILND